VADITSKYEEQRQLARINNRPWINRNTHSQLEYDAREKDVILDACHLFMTFMRTQYKGTDQRAVESFLKTFLGAFYDIDEDTMKASMADVFDNSPANEEADDEVRSHSGDNTATRRGRAPNGKGLLRGVLDRAQNGKKGKSNNYDSKESTPDVTSMDEDSAAQANSPDDNAPSDIAAKNWLQHPKTGNYRHPELLAKLNEPFKRTNHKLYANTNIYCFTRLFQMLYDRLVKIKKGEADAKAHVIRGLAAKPAIELRVADRSPTEYFANVGPDANYYRQMLTMFEDYLKGIEDLATVEETLRRFYLDFGWQMFAFDKLLISATKFASNIVTGEGKDKKSAQGPNLMNLFYQNRSLAETTAEIEISYRKEAKREVQDSDLFRIAYVSPLVLYSIVEHDSS
jgi:paired amphipathic helix protein Sin3a